MAAWLTDLSRAFKRHRQGRPGWSVNVARERLRVVSAELPPRPGEAPSDAPKRRSVTLATPPGPSTAAAALAEACALFDAVMAGTWSWPDPEALPEAEGAPGPATLERLVDRLQRSVEGEQVSLSTWQRHYLPPFRRLLEAAGQRHWPSDRELLEQVLKQWQPNSRARQLGHDRIRRLWREAGREWPEQVAALRGNGRAAAAPEGVRAFTDSELTELRGLIEGSRLGPADLVAWDAVIVFGLRPAELQGLELMEVAGQLQCRVTRLKRSSRGTTGARTVPAVPPVDWPARCWGLLERWQRWGLPPWAQRRSPGETMAQQLSRLQQRGTLDGELTPYGCRHAFALRLAALGLHVREAAALMGHSPAVHLSTYGRRLDMPGLLERVRERLLTGS